MVKKEEEKGKIVNVVDFKSAAAVKEFVQTANERIFILEDALYTILDTYRLDVVKEIAADALGEDLESYLEDDAVEELDFDKDQNMGLPWEEFDL